MITLALDTSLAAVQAAVVENEAQRAAFCEPMTRGHQERLAPLVAEALAAADATAGEIGKVAVTVGPGSFTGLRVGLAFAKAFALARGVPCVGVGTLEALAAAFPDGDVAAVVAAPRERAYVQRFTGGVPLAPPRLLAWDEAREATAGARLIGPGAPLLGGDEADACGWPDLAAFARLGARTNGPAHPIYLREVGALTVAERRAAAGGA